MKFNSEEEIEDWFEKRKEELEEEYYENLRADMDSKKAKDSFEKKLKKALNNYNEYYDKFWRAQERKKKLRKPIDAVEDRLSSLKEHISDHWNDWKEKINNSYEDFKTDAEKKKLELELKWHRFRHRMEENNR